MSRSTQPSSAEHGGRAVRGFNQNAVHVAAAMTYTLVVLFAALVGKGTATGREAVVRVALAVGIMLAPQLHSGTNVLISSPDHIGTSVPLLAAWLIVDRARPRLVGTGGRVPGARLGAGRGLDRCWRA